MKKIVVICLFALASVQLYAADRVGDFSLLDQDGYSHTMSWYDDHAAIALLVQANGSRATVDSIAEFEMIGFDDYCRPESVVVIEWADKIESALQTINYIRIELFHAGETQRGVHIENRPEYIAL